MTRLPALAATLLALTLAACQSANDGATGEDETARASIVTEAATLGEEPATGTTEMADAACNADPVQGLIGQHLTDALIDQALKDSGASIPRVLGPKTAATLDLSQTRLNIIIDEHDVIQSLHCG